MFAFFTADPFDYTSLYKQRYQTLELILSQLKLHYTHTVVQFVVRNNQWGKVNTAKIISTVKTASCDYLLAWNMRKTQRMMHSKYCNNIACFCLSLHSANSIIFHSDHCVKCCMSVKALPFSAQFQVYKCCAYLSLLASICWVVHQWLLLLKILLLPNWFQYICVSMLVFDKKPLSSMMRFL